MNFDTVNVINNFVVLLVSESKLRNVHLDLFELTFFVVFTKDLDKWQSLFALQ